MNKGVLFIGLGVVALGGLAYWYFSKPNTGTLASDMGGQKSASPETSGAGTDENIMAGIPSFEMKSRKQIRRDCRKEAREKCGTGLGKGKPKCRKNYRKECKAQGGFDDGVADFAFNGFDGAFEFA